MADRYRVLPGPDDDAVRLLDREDYEPVVVPREGDSGSGDPPVAALRPGYLVAADLDWSDPEPRVRSLTVERPTRYTFVDDAEPMFELAEELWRDAKAAGEGMNSCVTRNTDGEVVGALYVFADSGVRSRFEEFRDGSRPLEPLVDRINDRDDDGPAPRDVFVLRPADGEFVVVTIALGRDGEFPESLRETYDCPPPAEPLVD